MPATRLTTHQTKALRSTSQWAKARREALKRDNWTCQGIFVNNGNDCSGDEWLHVHHIVPLHLGGDPYSLHNLVTLCEFCHQAIHSRDPEVTFRLPAEATRVNLIELQMPEGDGRDAWLAYEAAKRAGGGQCPSA